MQAAENANSSPHITPDRDGWCTAHYRLADGAPCSRDHHADAIPVIVEPGMVALTHIGHGIVTEINASGATVAYAGGTTAMTPWGELSVGYCVPHPSGYAIRPETVQVEGLDKEEAEQAEPEHEPMPDAAVSSALHHPDAPGEPVSAKPGMRARVFDNQSGNATIGRIDVVKRDYGVLVDNDGHAIAESWSRIELVGVGSDD
ncbi:MAG: hypothetical protein AAFY08_11965 [Planctomycetota bacterium]